MLCSRWRWILFFIRMWEPVLTFIANFKVLVSGEVTSQPVSYAWRLMTLPHMNTIPDRSTRSSLGLQKCQPSIITPQQQQTQLLNSRSPITAWPKLSEEHTHPWLHPPPSILLTGWVTSWHSCWPCVRKFTAGCNHLLCSKCMMLELLHLLECAALYCKCAISIHEGIYMHF